MLKKGRELKQISWQVMIVLTVIPIVKPEFSEICLPHPTTTAPLMFLPISKNFAYH